MSCSNPLLRHRKADGSLTSNHNDPEIIGPMWLPCNHCQMCLKAKVMELTIRLQHEAYGHRDSISLTNTYADEHLPAHRSLSRRDYDLFVMGVRNLAARRYGAQIRVHGVGEYSPSPLLRPHYHILIYGLCPDDTRPWSKSRAGNAQYVSQQLSDLWGRGHVTFQMFSAGAATYVASHQSSKLKRKDAQELIVHTEQGIFHREPEFESRPVRPGLGRAFCLDHADQLLAHDFVVDHRGNRCPLPKYYDRLLERIDPGRMSELKAERARKAFLNLKDSTYDRLAVREEYAELMARRVSRELM